jgi:hypothetical protein
VHMRRMMLGMTKQTLAARARAQPALTIWGI